MNLEPIGNESVVNQVLKRLTDSIINQDIIPGEKLPTEVEFMEKLGVGRNSIREAIKMLAGMGVLEVKRGKGTYVSKGLSSTTFFNPLIFSLILEPKTGRDLYELRFMFDSMVLFLVMDKATDDDVKNIEDMINDVHKSFDQGNMNIDFFVKADIDFHIQMLNITHNPLIVRLGKTIVELFPNYIRKSLQQENGIRRSIQNHNQIISVIKSKNKSKVFEIIEKSLEEWKNEWKE